MCSCALFAYCLPSCMCAVVTFAFDEHAHHLIVINNFGPVVGDMHARILSLILKLTSVETDLRTKTRSFSI